MRVGGDKNVSDQLGKGVYEFTSDATGFKAGVADVKQAHADLAQTAKKHAKDVGDAVAKVGQAAAASASTAAAGAEEQVKKLDAQAKRLATTIRRLGDQSGIPRSQYLENRARTLGIFDQPGIQSSIAKIRAAEQPLQKIGLTAKQTAQAMRLLPAQITDIVTGLASGQPAYLVAIQQGGQLKDSFGGITPAAKALLTVFTPMRLALGGVAGAALLLAVAYKQGAAEIDAYNKAIISTGNLAGITAGQLQGMAAAIAASSSATQGQASAALAGLVGAGVTNNLQSLASTAAETAKRWGVAVEGLVKQYAELGKDPLKASIKLNEQQHYLTLATYEQIKALEEQGRSAEAAEVAQKAYADAQKERNRQLEASLGDYQRAWEALGNAAKKAWDWMLNIGRQPEPQQALAAAQERLDHMQRKGPGGGFGQFAQEEVDQQKALVAQLQASVDQANGLAAAQGRFNRLQQDAIKGAQLLEKYAPKKDQRASALREFEKAVADVQAGRTLNKLPLLTPAEIDAMRAEVLNKYKDRRGPTSKNDAATRMLQEAKKTEAALQAQLDLEQKLAPEAQKRVEFEALIADLKLKKILTADEKSLLANKDAIKAALEKNAALESEANIRETIRKQEEKARQEQIKFEQRATQIQDDLSASRQQRSDQQSRQLAEFGQGDTQREMIAAQRSIYAEYQRAQTRLRNARDEYPFGSDKYNDEVDKIRSALGLALSEHQSYYARLHEEQAKWQNGMSRGLYNYADNAANVAEQSERLFAGSFQGMEDALTKFVTTGKLSFQDLSDFVVAEVNRMIIRSQITGPLAQSMNSSGGGFVSTLMAAIFGGGAGLGYGTAGSAAATAIVPVAGGGYVPALAKGGVFGPSGLSAFDRGGVVTQPTLFGYAGGRTGLMAEAGYEAIMPVTRGSDGKLGVKASGGAAPQTSIVNIHLPGVRDYEGFRRSENQIKSRLSGWSMGARRVS